MNYITTWLDRIQLFLQQFQLDGFHGQNLAWALGTVGFITITSVMLGMLALITLTTFQEVKREQYQWVGLSLLTTSSVIFIIYLVSGVVNGLNIFGLLSVLIGFSVQVFCLYQYYQENPPYLRWLARGNYGISLLTQALMLGAASPGLSDNTVWRVAIIPIVVAFALQIFIFRKIFPLSNKDQKQVFWGYTFAGPWLVGFVIFVVGPSLASLFYSFTNYRIGDEFSFTQYEDFWIELENYRILLLGDGRYGRRFKQAMYNSFYYMLIGVPMQILAALAMAMLLNRKTRGISIFRTIFYLPVVLAASPAALLAWRYMLTSNGGFINNAFNWFADQSPVFDSIYRHFIYFMEGFNGFYEGAAKGDPIGPLKYTFPAFFGVLFLLFMWGEWNKGKRELARRIAEIMTIILIGNLMATGLMLTPVNLSWTYFSGLVVSGMVLVNSVQGKTNTARIWLMFGSLVFAISLYRTLSRSAFDLGNPNTQKYALAILISALPFVVAAFGKWSRLKIQVVSGLVALLALIIVVRAIPSNFGDNGWQTLTTQLTFGRTFEAAPERPDNIPTNYPSPEAYANVYAPYVFGLTDEEPDEYYDTRSDEWDAYEEEYEIYIEDLRDNYPSQTYTPNWIYGLIVAVLISLILLHERYPNARKAVLYGSTAFFVLFLVSTYLDSRAYYNAFENYTAVIGKPNYHFVLFREATDALPDGNRVPLWLSNNLWNKPSLILISTWSSGASMLIFLAALKGVPPVLYEAADVDGANNFQKFFKITLPMISPAMFYNIVIGVIASLQTFESIYIIRDPSGSNDSALMSAAYFLYTRTFNDLAIGQGAAASWILAVVILTITVMQFRYSNWVNYEA